MIAIIGDDLVAFAPAQQVAKSSGSLAIPWHQPRSGRRHHFGWFRHDPRQSLGPLGCKWIEGSGWLARHTLAFSCWSVDHWSSKNHRNSQGWGFLMWWLWTVLSCPQDCLVQASILQSQWARQMSMSRARSSVVLWPNDPADWRSGSCRLWPFLVYVEPDNSIQFCGGWDGCGC